MDEGRGSFLEDPDISASAESNVGLIYGECGSRQRSNSFFFIIHTYLMTISADDKNNNTTDCYCKCIYINII